MAVEKLPILIANPAPIDLRAHIKRIKENVKKIEKVAKRSK